MQFELDREIVMPDDGCRGTLIGRAWVPDDRGIGGPCVVVVTDHGVYDISGAFPTCADLMNAENPSFAVANTTETFRIGGLDEIIANSAIDRRDPARPWFLTPIDLQSIKAAGVTFLDSLIERVVEELAKGDPAGAQSVRETIAKEIGSDLSGIRPGSPEAERFKETLVSRNLWSPYLEVGIGPFAEVFTKSQPMAAVGVGAEIGVPEHSSWNNPEPEAVLVINGRGQIVGATLGNDVNLRDIEGRSALLLGRAKDNNASCAIGPFIRLFDQTFGLDDLRRVEVSLAVMGDDQFSLAGVSNLGLISRDVEDLASQTINPNHQYPDGLVLMTGTMFAPTQDRGEKGQGFTHHIGDIVTIASPPLGALVNRIDRCDRIEPWSFGCGALMRNLAARGLLASKS